MTSVPTKNDINKALCYASSGYTLNRNITSTGFCIESNLMQNDAQDELAEVYLLNSAIDNTNVETIYSINKYLNYPLTEATSLSSNVVYQGIKKVKLEKSCKLDLNLDEVIRRRQTSRKYTGDYVPINYLSTVLRSSNGITHTVKDCNFERKQRTCPSGGGLYPVKIYVLANKVRNLPKGIYLYDPINDCLFLREEKTNRIDRFLNSQKTSQLPNIIDTSFIIFFTLEAWKSVSKYGAAGLRFAYIELGGIAQNAHLAATALGIGSCAYSSFKTKNVDKILRIDGYFEAFQHAILFGVKSGV